MMTFNPTQIYNEAHQAGLQALKSAQPTPMVVGQETHFNSNQIDYAKPTYYVSDGVCGFAWIVVKPANSKFGKWLKTNGYARPHYGGGLSIWVREGRQSLQLKEAYAYTFASVLSKYGIKAYADSRMD
jgi:hypothetical protein